MNKTKKIQKANDYKFKIIKASINEECDLVELAIMNNYFAKYNLDLTIDNLNRYIMDRTGCKDLNEYIKETRE